MTCMVSGLPERLARDKSGFVSPQNVIVIVAVKIGETQHLIAVAEPHPEQV